MKVKPRYEIKGESQTCKILTHAYRKPALCMSSCKSVMPLREVMKGRKQPGRETQQVPKDFIWIIAISNGSSPVLGVDAFRSPVTQLLCTYMQPVEIVNLA